MIRELQLLTKVTDLATVKLVTNKISASYVADLEFRLQQANSHSRKLLRSLNEAKLPEKDEIDHLVNTLTSLLNGLDPQGAVAYLTTFGPGYFKSVELHPLLEREVKRVLMQYCTDHEMTPLYKVWSET